MIYKCSIHFKATDILTYFEDLTIRNQLPTLDSLLATSRGLARRFASQKAYEQALSLEESRDANADMKIPVGAPWAPGSMQADPVAARSVATIADVTPGHTTAPEIDTEVNGPEEIAVDD